MEMSPGVIINIKEDNITFYHSCDTSGGSSGGPIINKMNFNIIGVHKGGGDRGRNYNLGTLLKEPVEKFIEEINSKKNSIDNNCITNNGENIWEIIEKNKNSIEEYETISDKTIKNNNDKKKFEDNEELTSNGNNENEDEIAIKYIIDDIGESKNIKIFGDNFVDNNYKICKININGNDIELCTDINVNKNQLNNNIYEIKLKGIKKVTNMSYMFSNCKYLSSLTNLSKWNTKNVIDMSYMFYNCETLSYLPDISKWNTQNVNNMKSMFSSCRLLLSLPDISNWNTQNVTDMSYICYFCRSLSSLPDISNWNTQKVSNMSYLFYDCELLSSLPDISKWDTQKVTNMSYMFHGCKSLSSLPNIYNWKTRNVINAEHMFSGCPKLTIPKKFMLRCSIF